MKQEFTVGVIVNNHYGVLHRVSGLFGKRGYNIDSLAVGETENPAYSRITIVSSGDDYTKEQVVKQLLKLHDVKRVYLFDEERTVSLDHLIIKLQVDGINKAEVNQLINSYSGKVMDFDTDFVTVEITGHTDKINQFIEKTREFGILELCRSGRISLVRGNQDLLTMN